MADAERLLDLLVEWEDRRLRGEVATAEQLCPDDTALQEELRQRIRKRQKFQPLLDDTAATVANVAAGKPSIPRIEGYEILDVIGAGGMGVVYKAVQTRLQRHVALKMILSGPLASGEHLRRFRAEAEAVARMQHPNIVQIFEIGEQDKHPYLALEYVAGGSLAHHLQGAPLAPRRVAEVMLHLARAIQHAHELGIVHRDLKPANVLLTEAGIPKIADFGLAKRLDQDSGQTDPGAILGSPSYMAPEQAEGRIADVSAATDIYALGAILYEMLTGRPPFNGTSILETLEHVRTLDPVAPKTLQPGVPKDLEIICLKCLEKRPRDRYRSAQELAQDLEFFLAGEPITAKLPTFREGLERMIRRGNFDPRFRSFGTWLICASPFPLLIHLCVYGLFRHHGDFPIIITWTSILVIFLVQTILLVGNTPKLRIIPPHQSRHFVTVWCANFVSVPLVWLIVWFALPADQPQLLFLVYPLWVAHLAQSFYAFAAEAGAFYITGTVISAISLALVFVLPWMPLILGFMMLGNMMTHGILLRRGVGFPAHAKD
jgi:serine/threonine protein kinase